MKPVEFLQEDGLLTFVNDGYVTFILQYDSPTHEEIESFNTDEITIGLNYLFGKLIFLLHFKEFGWVDSYYSKHFTEYCHSLLEVPFLNYKEDSFKGVNTCPIVIYIIDSNNTEVKAKRILEAPKEFAKKIIEANTSQTELLKVYKGKFSDERIADFHIKGSQLIHTIPIEEMVSVTDTYYKF